MRKEHGIEGGTMELSVDDLAVFTGKPAFAEPLHVGRPNLGDREKLLQRLNDVLDRRWVTNAGRYVREFEAAIAETVGVRHCIAMCNATVALEILIRAAELSGEVIVPSFTFIATAHALQWQEITPVFADIDPHTHNLDPARVEEMITPRTTGIIGVHLWGRACDVERLQDIAQRHHLKLLFDAAHAFGCSHRGRMAGSFGQGEVFSFHGTKFVNSGEGGAVVTNDDEIAARIRLMKNFGFAGKNDQVVYLGTNGKMSEFCAAFGLTNFEAMAEIIAANRRHYEHYRSELGGLPGISMVDYSTSEKANYQYIVLEVDAETAGISRDSLLRVPPCRERARPAVFLSGLPSHGAVPVVLSPCGTAPAAHGSLVRAGPQPSQWDHSDRARRDHGLPGDSNRRERGQIFGTPPRGARGPQTSMINLAMTTTGKHSIIGGAFGLGDVGVSSAAVESFLKPPHWLLCNARSGIWAVIQAVRPAQVWMPSYLCSVMVDAVDQDRCRLRFYEVDYDLKIREDRWIRDVAAGDLVVFIDYFGFSTDRRCMASVRDRRAWVLEDACQAMLSKHVGAGADFALQPAEGRGGSRRWNPADPL